MVTFDPQLCVGCGLCKKDCPGNAITIQDGTASYKGSCILCGHCVAICPTGAASIPSFDMEDVEEYRKEDFSLEPERFLRCVKFRRSIRSFQDKPLDHSVLQQIMEAGRYTATAKNRQGTRYLIVQDHLKEFKELFWKEFPSILQVLEQKESPYARFFKLLFLQHQRDPQQDGFFFNSPSLLLVLTENLWDGAMAAANMEHMANALGAGMLYSGFLKNLLPASSILMDWLDVKPEEIACCILLGYPDHSYRRTAPRKPASIIWK